MFEQSSIVVDLESWNENSYQISNDNAKRRCLHVPVRDKLKQLKRMEKGESAKIIAQELGLSPATVRRWRHYRDEYEKLVDIENRKRVRGAANPRLDEAVYTWFEKQRALGIAVSGTVLKGKATEFNEKLGGDGSFNASDGWLSRWKSRHGASLGTTDDDDSTIGEKSQITFEAHLSNILKSDMNLTSSQVFNVAVTKLYYQLLPIRPNKWVRGGWGTSPDHVTIMTCSNADSTLKHRLLVIGKSSRPRGLKNVRQLTIPVCYAHQESAMLNSQIFGDWFVNEFAPRVTDFLVSKNMPLRALLLLDDTDPISPDLAIGGIKTMLVSSNERLTMRNLKHKVTEDLKRRYRRSLLESASDAQDKGHDPVQHVKFLSMKDIVFRLDDAWTDVTQEAIVESWNNLVPPLVPLESDPLAIEDQTEENVLLNLLRKIAINEDITERDVNIWMMDNEPMSKATRIGTNGFTKFVKMEKQRDRGSATREDDDVITSTEAVEALDTVIEFFEHHGRLSDVELAALRKARDVAFAIKMKNQ